MKTETASWLCATNRVLAADQRGHGESERRPVDLSRQAFVDDAAMWIRELAGSRAVVIGQSLGGHTAFLLAAEHPDLVRALVVAEASPAADPQAQGIVGGWLRSWPVPFPSRHASLAFLAATHFGHTRGPMAWMYGPMACGPSLMWTQCSHVSMVSPGLIGTNGRRFAALPSSSGRSAACHRRPRAICRNCYRTVVWLTSGVPGTMFILKDPISGERCFLAFLLKSPGTDGQGSRAERGRAPRRRDRRPRTHASE